MKKLKNTLTIKAIEKAFNELLDILAEKGIIELEEDNKEKEGDNNGINTISKQPSTIS